jgi:hypothetical protein
MVHFSGSFKLLRCLLLQLCPKSIEMADSAAAYPGNARIMKVYDAITVVHQPNLVTIEASSYSISDEIFKSPTQFNSKN